MRTVMIVLQLAAALGLLNVWLLRFNRGTAYRGGNATSMTAEFAAYGLPAWFAYTIGALKVASALALIAGIWLSQLVLPASTLICILMLGALAMHARIRDPMKKFLPALGMLALSASIVWVAMH